jgi:hypothetical protein
MSVLPIVTNEMEECIQECLNCHRVCMQVFSHLLTLESDAQPATPDQLRLLLDCAQLCALCADFLIRASEFDTSLSHLCREACRRCQQMCETLGQIDLMVPGCAVACARCANACTRVLTTAAASAAA